MVRDTQVDIVSAWPLSQFPKYPSSVIDCIFTRPAMHELSMACSHPNGSNIVACLARTSDINSFGYDYDCGATFFLYHAVVGVPVVMGASGDTINLAQ